jgi:hypothetical protein
VTVFPEGRSYLVECYWPGVSEETVAALSDHVRSVSAEFRRDGIAVDLVESILVPGDETVFCIFTGDEEHVRAVSARAGVPLERVVESLRFQADGVDGATGGAKGARSEHA